LSGENIRNSNKLLETAISKCTCFVTITTDRPRPAVMTNAGKATDLLLIPTINPAIAKTQ